MIAPGLGAVPPIPATMAKIFACGLEDHSGCVSLLKSSAYCKRGAKRKFNDYLE